MTSPVRFAPFSTMCRWKLVGTARPVNQRLCPLPAWRSYKSILVFCQIAGCEPLYLVPPRWQAIIPGRPNILSPRRKPVGQLCRLAIALTRCMHCSVTFTASASASGTEPLRTTCPFVSEGTLHHHHAWWRVPPTAPRARVCTVKTDESRYVLGP